MGCKKLTKIIITIIAFIMEMAQVKHIGESNRIRKVPESDTLGISETINPTKNI